MVNMRYRAPSTTELVSLILIAPNYNLINIFYIKIKVKSNKVILNQ